MLRHGGGASVVAVFDDRTVALVRQYRHPTGGFVLELPAGKLEADERPEACAAREMEEELGVVSQRLELLAEFFTTPGFCSEKLWVYLATGLTETATLYEDDEIIEIVRMPFERALEMVAAREIEDAKTIIGILLTAPRLGFDAPPMPGGEGIAVERVDTFTTTQTTHAPVAGDDLPRTAAPRRPTLADRLRSAIAIPLIYLYTIVMATISLAVSFFDPRGRRQHWCAWKWSRMIARTAGARVRVHGAEHICAGASYVFLSTHQSYMDIPVMLGYLPAQLRIAAKREVFMIPFLGWHMRRAGHISINRGSTTDAVETLRRATSGIRDGVCAFLFPEGTRSRDGALHPFKKGGFKLAIQTGVPIIPVSIIGTRALLPCDSIIFRPGLIDMHIDAPIPTAGLTDTDVPQLIEAVRAAMLPHFKAQPVADSTP